MAKYYVGSGNMSEILIAENPQEAVKRAIQRNIDKKGTSFGLIIGISEVGFSFSDDEALFVSTEKWLKDLGYWESRKFRVKNSKPKSKAKKKK